MSVSAPIAPERPHASPLASRLEDRPALRGWALIVLILAAGLAIFFFGAHGVGDRPASLVIGQTLGIIAAILLCLTAMLAVRIRLLEWLFGDMTKVYVAHGIVGLTMFFLVTLHPLLYVVGALDDPAAAAGIIVPFKLVVLDWISWITIALALLPTLFVRLPFDLWRYSHFFLGAALVDTWISLTLTSRTFDTITVPALHIYLLVLFGLAIAAVLYMIVFRRIVEPKREYRVVAATPHPEARAIELHLEPVGKPLRHVAGQFTYVDLVDDRIQVHRGYAAHPYSISSAPGDEHLSVIIHAEGETTTRAQGIAARDDAHALVHGAYGRLGFGREGFHKRLWVGGGLGITPFLSLARDLANDPNGRDVVLVVCIEQAEQAFFLERLQDDAERSGGALRVVLWETAHRGHPTADALIEEVPDLGERNAVLSGPDPMVAALTDQLHEAGVPHLHSEIAIGPPRRWREGGSKALRRMRWVIGIEMAVFVTAVLVATIGRALG